MTRRSQYLVSRNVPQRVDGSKRTPGAVRRNKLIPAFRLACDDPVYFIVNMHFIHEVLSDMVKELMKVAVVVIYIACVWRMVVVLLQYSESDTAVYAECVYWNKALVSGLLLNYRESTVSEVLRADAHQV
jgi:hypothetical protein